MLSYYPSLVSYCTDYQTCLTDFYRLSRHILSKKNAAEPSSSSSDSSDSSEDEDEETAETDGGSTGKGKGPGGPSGKKKSSGSNSGKKSSGSKSGKGSGSKERGSEEDDGNLFRLCQQINKKWDCAMNGMHWLSPVQRSLQMHILSPLRSIVSARCAVTGEWTSMIDTRGVEGWLTWTCFKLILMLFYSRADC